MNKIFLTVDVECHNLKQKNMYIDGKIGDTSWGLSRILEVGKEKNIPINFFVDVVECHKYGDEYINEIIDLIHSYGQKTYLHIHPDFLDMGGYHYFWEYSKGLQQDIIRQSIIDFKRLVGYFPKAIRTGGYCNNQDYYDALGEVSGENMIDVSHCVNYRNSLYSAPTINKIHSNGKVKVLPNTRFLCFKFLHHIKHANLDIMSANMNEMKRVLKHQELSYMTCTMHSWTLLKHFFYKPKTLRPDRHNYYKMQEFIDLAKSMGWVFSNFEESLTIQGGDSNIDLCETLRGKILGVINSFFRMQRAARVNKKYFMVYAIFYLVMILCIIVLTACLL